MQSGTTGINAIRIYNPIKQGMDHDPEGIFIKKWLPELGKVPMKNIHMPWEDAKNITDYMAPIVNETEARKAAANKIFKLRREKSHKLEADQIYIKHGSRKSRPKKIKTKIKEKRPDIQKSLF